MKIIFELAFLLSLSANLSSVNAEAVVTVAVDIQEVSQIILEKKDWLAESTICPDKLIAKSQKLNYLELNSCAKNLQQCLVQCEEGSGDICYVLANNIQTSGGSDLVVEALFQRSCKLGIMSGCTNHAAGMMHEKPKDKSVLRCAAKTYMRVCEFDDPWACTMMAFHFSRGLGVSKNLYLALEKLKKSCKFGEKDPACTSGLALKKEIEQALTKQHK